MTYRFLPQPTELHTLLGVCVKAMDSLSGEQKSELHQALKVFEECGARRVWRMEDVQVACPPNYSEAERLFVLKYVLRHPDITLPMAVNKVLERRRAHATANADHDLPTAFDDLPA